MSIWELMEKPRIPAVLAGTKKKPPLLAEAIYLDTETSHNYNVETGEGYTWIYQWAFRWCRQAAFGRTPSELMAALDRIDQANGLTRDGVKCVIFIHNASYDLSYLMPFFRDKYGIDSVLATSPHKIITFSSGPWEVRCTYRLSNRSLWSWGEALGIKRRKKKGMIDYTVRRYQDSKLVRKDWVYQLYDVLALEECVLTELSLAHDTLRSIPLTSTGYIRRDGRKLAREAHDRKEFLKTRLSSPVYKCARFAFAGGLTHGNRFYSGKIVRLPDANGRHRDFRSMYPSEMRKDPKAFPAGPFQPYYTYDPYIPCTWEEVDKRRPEYCQLITCLIDGATLKQGETLPYLQISKCLLGNMGGWKCDIADNGRVIECSGKTTVTMTELDWEIIRRQYDGTFKILEVWESKRGPIPKYLADLVDKYYVNKTDFKDIVGDLEEAGAEDVLIRDAKINLMKSKNGVNGIYGMSATDPVRQEWELDRETWEWKPKEKSIDEALDKFYNSRNSFMRYQIGIYVTALARYDLMQMYWLIGPENFLYGDTDSIFYISSPEIEARIDAENRRRYEAAIANGAYVTSKRGELVTYDAFELEKHKHAITKKKEVEKIKAFIFLHAKAYCYITDDEQLHVTVAGVAAVGEKGITREQELGSIENFKSGFVFRKCGSNSSVYLTMEPEIVTVEGHRIETAGGCVLVPTTKTLHDEYDVGLDTAPEWISEPTRMEVKG